MRNSSLIIALFILCACATTGSDYNAKVRSWQGSSIESLQKNWGPATYTIRTPDGRTTYAYDIKYQNPMPNVPTFAVVNAKSRPAIVAVNNNYPYQNYSLEYCNITIRTNSQHIIVSTDVSGTSCFRAISNLSANPHAH